jgi:transposase
MLVIPEGKKIFVYTQPFDMRKGVNGIVIALLEAFDQNPQTGDYYLFVNRQRNMIKCLFWSGNGFSLYYLRLEKGRFNYSKDIREDKIIVTEQQFKALLLGLDFHLLGDSGLPEYTDFF